MGKKEDAYLNLQTCSQGRIQKIKNVFNVAKRILKKDLSALQMSDITLILREINNSNFSIWTKNDFKKIFKSFLKSQYKKEFYEWNDDNNFKKAFKQVSPIKSFNTKKINKDTLLKPDELEKLIRTATTLKLKALISLLFESAFRPCELVNLKWKDLNFDDSRGLCFVKTVSPKTNEFRQVPVKDCIIHLKRWRREFSFPNRTDEDWVFPSPKNKDKHITEGSLNQILKRLSIKANLKRKIFPYLFRHSRIYEIQKKLGSRLSSKFAGHSLQVSEIYNHLDFEDVTESMLEKIYVNKELTEPEKNKLEKLQENFSDLKEDYDKTKKNLIIQKITNQLFLDFNLGKMKKDDFIKKIKELRNASKNLKIDE